MPDSTAPVRRHQVSVPGAASQLQHPFAQGVAPGCEHDGTGAHLPRLPALAVHAGGLDHVLAVFEQFEGGMMVEDFDPGAQCPALHEMHVVRSAQIGAIDLAVVVTRKRIAPFGKAVQFVPDRVELRSTQAGSARPPVRGIRAAMAAWRRSPGGGDQVPVLAGAVAPLVPT